MVSINPAPAPFSIGQPPKYVRVSGCIEGMSIITNARPVVGCHSTQESRGQMHVDDVAGDVCMLLPLARRNPWRVGIACGYR
jgi:hypothetical protein